MAVEHDHNGNASDSFGKGEIMRIEGAGTLNGADGLGRIERWAEEVVSSCIVLTGKLKVTIIYRNCISHPKSYGYNH